MLLLCLFRGRTVGQNLNAGLLIHRQAFSCVRHSDCLSRRHFLRPALVSLLSVISPLLMKVRQACLCVCEGVRGCACVWAREFLVESRVPHLRVYAQLKHRTTIPPLWWKSFLNLNELWGSPGWAAVNPKSSSQASMWRRAQRERNGKWKSELVSVQFKKAHHICCGATSETSRHLNSCQSPSRGKGNNAVQCVKFSMFFFLYFSERHHFLRKQPWKWHLQFSSFFLLETFSGLLATATSLLFPLYPCRRLIGYMYISTKNVHSGWFFLLCNLRREARQNWLDCQNCAGCILMQWRVDAAGYSVLTAW